MCVYVGELVTGITLEHAVKADFQYVVSFAVHQDNETLRTNGRTCMLCMYIMVRALFWQRLF